MNIIKVGVSIILINQSNEVLVGKRKGSHGAGLLSVPGGHLEYGEQAVTACQRELLEEIGLEIELNRFEKLTYSEDFFENGKQYITLYFMVNNFDSTSFEVKNLEPEKCESWEWVSIDDLPNNMFCDTYNVIKALQL